MKQPLATQLNVSLQNDKGNLRPLSPPRLLLPAGNSGSPHRISVCEMPSSPYYRQWCLFCIKLFTKALLLIREVLVKGWTGSYHLLSWKLHCPSLAFRKKKKVVTLEGNWCSLSLGWVEED